MLAIYAVYDDLLLTINVSSLQIVCDNIFLLFVDRPTFKHILLSQNTEIVLSEVDVDDQFEELVPNFDCLIEACCDELNSIISSVGFHQDDLFAVGITRYLVYAIPRED